MTAKETALALIHEMPDDVTAGDLYAALEDRFGPESYDEWEAAWSAEINRRVEDCRAGKTTGIPHDVLMAELREKYG